MKFIFALIFCAALSYSPVQSHSIKVELEEEFKIPTFLVQHGSELMAKGIASLFLHGISSGILEIIGKEHFDAINNYEDKTAILVPIFINFTIPTLPDPVPLLPVNIPLNFNGPDLVLEGFFNINSAELVGLSGTEGEVSVSYDFPVKTARIELSIFIPSIMAESDYETDVFMSQPGIDDMKIIGSGRSSGGFTGFYVNFTAVGQVPIQGGWERLTLDHLDFDFGFEDVTLFFENLQLNGEDVQLDAIPGLIKSLYNLIWVPSRLEIVEAVRKSIDHIINDCPLLDLIAGVWDCLQLPSTTPGPSTTPRTTIASDTTLSEEPNDSSSGGTTVATTDDDSAGDTTPTSSGETTPTNPTSTTAEPPSSSTDAGASGLTFSSIGMIILLGVTFF